MVFRYFVMPNILFCKLNCLISDGLFGEMDLFYAHLKIFTRSHTQLTLCGGEEVLREEEVKDVEGDEDEDDDEGEDEDKDGDEGALASSSSVVRKSRGESNGQRPEKRARQNSIQT